MQLKIRQTELSPSSCRVFLDGHEITSGLQGLSLEFEYDAVTTAELRIVVDHLDGDPGRARGTRPRGSRGAGVSRRRTAGGGGPLAAWAVGTAEGGISRCLRDGESRGEAGRDARAPA